MNEAEKLVCAALRGEGGTWRQLRDEDAETCFLDAAAAHRVRPLLAWRLHQSGELAQWPATIRTALTDAARGEAAVDVVRRQELGRLLDAFARAGIPVVVLKGAALACSTYPEPWLRPREDTDLLVRGA